MQRPEAGDSQSAAAQEQSVLDDTTNPPEGRQEVDRTRITIGNEAEHDDSIDIAGTFLGETLNGRFEIQELVGEGGMSYVYKARDNVLNKYVALKMLRPYLLHEANSVRRLRKEAMATSSLDHPHTVGVRHFDVTAEGLPYLVMDFLVGPSIADLLNAEGHIEPKRAAKILIQVAQALAHAHNQGIIHRDLKANNILLVKYDGEPDFVKVVDFGIAKVATGDGGAPNFTSNLTMTGEIFGSPIAMSPEQCRGDKVDLRSDIYSFGCLMYEMLTGKPVFSSKNTLELLFKQLNEMPASFKETSPKLPIPPQLEAIAFKALQKDPKDRYQSMQELLESLEEASDTNLWKEMQVRVNLAARSARRNVGRNARLRVAIALCVLCFVAALALERAYIGSAPTLLAEPGAWKVPPYVTSSSGGHLTKKQIDEIAAYVNDGLPNTNQSGPGAGSDTMQAVERLRNYGRQAAAVGAQPQVKQVAEAALTVNGKWQLALLASSSPERTRQLVNCFKDLGDDCQQVGLFEDAEYEYRAAADMVRTAGDHQFLTKLAADSAYMNNAALNKPVSEYGRVLGLYEQFFHELRPEFSVFSAADFGGSVSLSTQSSTDLADTPLAWDAIRKKADCEYVMHNYSAALSDYREFAKHPQAASYLSSDDDGLTHARQADCERILSVAGSLLPEVAERQAEDALSNYRLALTRWTGTTSKANSAMCRAFIAGLLHRFKPPVAPQDDVSLTQALSETTQTFGANDRLTLLVQAENGERLMQQGDWWNGLKSAFSAKWQLLNGAK